MFATFGTTVQPAYFSKEMCVMMGEEPTFSFEVCQMFLENFLFGQPDSKLVEDNEDATVPSSTLVAPAPSRRSLQYR